MTARLFTAAAGPAVVAVLALGGASPALAAKAHHRSHARNHARRHAADTSASSTGRQGNGSGETALTGDTLNSASAAALVVVIENASFSVLVVQAAGDGCGGSGPAGAAGEAGPRR